MQNFESLKAETGIKLLEFSEFYSKFPAGNWFRDQYVGKQFPLARLLGIRVNRLLPGHCVCSLADKRRVHNDHYSIDEMAIASLAAHTSRLAMATSMPEGSIANLVATSTEHLRSAHGKLTAVCRCEFPKPGLRLEYTALIEIYASNKSLVARASATWYVRPQVAEHQFET